MVIDLRISGQVTEQRYEDFDEDRYGRRVDKDYIVNARAPRMTMLSCAFCEDPVGDDSVEIDEDPVLEDKSEDKQPWFAHSDCWHRHQASLDQMRRMFENLDKDYEAHTDIEVAPATNVDEDELDEEVADIEEVLDELLDERDDAGA